MLKVFRYVFSHRENGDVQYQYFMIEEIEEGKARESIGGRNEDGYELIARNAHTGLADMDSNAIYEDDLLNVAYNGLGTHRVELKDGRYTVSQFDLSKCRVDGTIHD